MVESPVIASSCPHCGSGCQLHYALNDENINSLTDDTHSSILCDVGQCGLQYANQNVTKSKKMFDKAVDAVKRADALLCSSFMSNEEALILQKIKEKTGAKLISPEARAYQKFMQAYASITGKHLYSGTLEAIASSSTIITLGTRLNDDAPAVMHAIDMAQKRDDTHFIYMHPIEDRALEDKITQFIKYEPSTEEGVVALLVDMLLSEIEVSEATRAFLEELDIGNLSAESNVGEEEISHIREVMVSASNTTLVVGVDLYAHPRAAEIAKIVALIEKYTEINLLCIPPAGNAMGISLICELDDSVTGTTVGYNVKADFVLSSLGANNDDSLDMPALNQQSGTLTTHNKTVVALNSVEAYEGYRLNDIANALGITATDTTAYTQWLPSDKGFQGIAFNIFIETVQSKEAKDYCLHLCDVPMHEELEEVDEIESVDGALLYTSNPKEHFSPFTYRCESLQKEPNLVGSPQFASAVKLTDGECITFEINGISFNRVFKIDTFMKGIIALNPIYDMELSTPLVSSYKFNRLIVIKKNDRELI